ncbi:MAG: DUF4491 family protein [Clostridiaceae bacterium]|jgi:hypothetical protein|nr:DUF4491 family protein [Clostridiaceae bacterium]
MNFQGIIIGVISFLVIGIFHPIVIKCEYYFSCHVWPFFLLAGIVSILVSLFVANSILSSTLGVLGCSCIWSIRELFEQRDRVAKGWFPANPKRK